MAKRKSVKTRTRTIVKRVKSRAKKKGTIEKVFAKAMTAMAYGAVRPLIAEKISPFVQNIPAGQYTDEIGLLIVSGLGEKYSKGMLKDVFSAGFLIESASLGQQVGSQLLTNRVGNTQVRTL